MSKIIEYCDLLDKLAELEHKQWSHWINYQLSEQLESRDDWQKWIKQAQTPYGELSEKEKKSDREWARKVLDLIHKEISIHEAFEKQIRYVMTNNLTLRATQIVTILKIVEEELLKTLENKQ